MTEATAAELPIQTRRAGFDPAPELTELRETEPVHRYTNEIGLDVWLLTRHEDIRDLLADTEHFSNDVRLDRKVPGLPDISDEELARMRAGNLLTSDPPDHTRLRRMLTPEFTVRRMRRLEPRIAQIVTDHLDAMQQAGPPADLVPDFALPVPSLVICELLGVPYADRQEFQERSARLLDLTVPVEERVRASRENRDYMASLVAREQADPGEELIGMLIREHGDELSTDELIGIAGLLLIAGHETTANMLGLGTLALLRHPEQLATIRDDDAAVGPAIEELLRWLSIVHTGSIKMTTKDVRIGGQTIPKGELVAWALPTANRDPAAIDDPDRLDISRGTMGHLAFGHGVHHCLGAPLARMEMRTAFPALLRRFPNLAEVPGGAQFRVGSVIYGLSSLPVTW